MSFKNRQDDRDDIMSEINMIPLVDVMLVLLIVCMLTAPVMTHSVLVNLPNASATPVQATPETISISIASDGGISWNGKPLDEAELKTRLQLAAEQNVSPEIHIYGDKQAAYEHIVNTMALAQQAGIEKLGFITKPAP